MFSGDTIAAISSATGRAARMIVRLSGPEAIAISRRLWTSPAADSNAAVRGTANNLARLGVASAKPVILSYAEGSGRDGESARSFGLPQDDAHRTGAQGYIGLRGMNVPAWFYLFRSPRSYTGEDSVELHIPGNPLLAKILLEEMLAAGARAAEPGEFTARAYFNGRLDLTEAEGVAATIAAGNEQELAAARRLLSGELARRLAPAIDMLANTLALLEVGIDFTDEDVTFLPAAELARRIADVDGALRKILDESSRFERLTHEPTVVLVGRPNAGKSTLLNALAGHDRAVVSPIAGTTRDVLSAEVVLPRGIIRMMDVAGLEQETGSVLYEGQSEQQRIDQKMREHALRALEEATWVLLVRDASDARPPLPIPRDANLKVLSKCDLVPSSGKNSVVVGEASNVRRALPAIAPRGGQCPRYEEHLCVGSAMADADEIGAAKGASSAAPALSASAKADPMGLVSSPACSDRSTGVSPVAFAGDTGGTPVLRTGPSPQPSSPSTGEREQENVEAIPVSAVTGFGLDVLRQSLDRLCFGQASTTASLALNARHVRAIEDARAALSAAAGQVHAGPEFVASELREALDALGRVSGKISPDDLLGRIFSAFCIGK